VAALVLGALALIAVYHISEESSSFIAESDNSDELTKGVDSFLEEAVSQGDAPEAFHQYKIAKNAAAKKASPTAFKAAEKKCMLLRTGAYKKCGAFYCQAKASCGHKCQKLFGMPTRQVVPLARKQGSRFYLVHEVKAKENNAKERRSKEQDAKEAAEKVRRVQEAKYKTKVAKEKKTKEVKRKELDSKEKIKKEKKAKERKKKENKEKAQEAAAKAERLLKCTKQGDQVKVKCVEKKKAELKYKAERAAARKKLAEKKKELQEKEDAKKAYSSGAQAQVYASDAHLQVYASEAAFASGVAATAAEEYASGAAEAVVTDGNAKAAHDVYQTYESAVAIAKAVYAKSSKVTQSLPSGVIQAVASDAVYEDKAIPPGGTLVQIGSGTAVGDSYGSSAAPAPVPVPPTSAPTTPEAAVAHATAEIARLGEAITQEKGVLNKVHKAAAKQVKKTTTAHDALRAAEDAFSNANDEKTAEQNDAKLHASKAALAESKVSAVDSYVSTHRGKLHKTSCSEEKKFAFNVCFGRAEYKGQLLQTKKAKEARHKADKYKKLMGHDYKIVLETNSSYVENLGKSKASEKTVKDAQIAFMHDSAQREEDKYLLKEGKQKIAEAKAEALRRKAEELAHASMAGAAAAPAPAPVIGAPVATGSAAGSAAAEQVQLVEDTMEPQLYEQQADFYDQLLHEPQPSDVVEEDAFVGRRLLTTKHKRSEKCSAASDKAYDECTNVVDEAYLHCAQIFKGLRL
jgi:hypothetical protein